MEITLLKDADWEPIEDEACKVIEFTPHARMENDKIISTKSLPYASVRMECSKLRQDAFGLITHKLDFINLWTAFNVRGVDPSEEVIIIWSRRHLRWGAKLLVRIMPRLCVMICKKGAYHLMTDPHSSPELRGEARSLAQMPIVMLKPEVWT